VTGRAGWPPERYLAGPSFPDGRQYEWSPKTPSVKRCATAAASAAEDAWERTVGDAAPGWVGGRVARTITEWWSSAFGPAGPDDVEQQFAVRVATAVPQLAVAYDTAFRDQAGFQPPVEVLGTAVCAALSLLAQGYDLRGVVDALTTAGGSGDVHVASRYTTRSRARERVTVALEQVRTTDPATPWWQTKALLTAPKTLAATRWLATTPTVHQVLGGASVAQIEAGTR